MEFSGSGGVKRVAARPWVRCEWGPVRIRDSSWVHPNPSLRPFMARSRHVLPIGAAFGTIRGVSRNWWCQTGRVTGPMGPIVSGDPSGSVASLGGPLKPSLRPSLSRSRGVLPIGAAFTDDLCSLLKMVVSNGSSRDHGSVVSGGPSGSVTPPGALQILF